MGVRIQELPETTGINKEDVLIVEDGQGTKKGTVQQLDEALGVSQLKEDLVYFENEIRDDVYVKALLEDTRYEDYGWDGNPAIKVSSSYMKCCEIPVTPCKEYAFDLQIGNNWLGIMFVDDAYNVITSYIKQNSWANYKGYIVKCPTNATKVLVNSNKNGALSCYEYDYNSIATKEYVDNDKCYKYKLPTYYNDHISQKIDEINNANGKDEKNDYYSVSYPFITDCHAQKNTWTFLPLLERIKENTNAKMLINCGDNVRAFGTKEDLLNDLHEVMNKTYSIFGKDMLYVLGNHDFIISNSDTWGTNMIQISKALNYQINLSPLDITSRKHYYYHDDNVGMIRHIVIDYLDFDKKWFIEWLRDTIKNTPADYHLAFYMHWNVFEQNGNISDTKYQYLVDWLSAIQQKTVFNQTISTTFDNVNINEDYTNTTLAICYFACGHQHKDYIHKVNGVTYFVSDCCANYNDNGIVERVAGTTTDTAFDVICVNVKNRTVKLVRVGAGSNREWAY